VFQFETTAHHRSTTQATATPVIAAVRAAIRRLDPDQQELVGQLYYFGRTIPELAAATGSSRSRLEAQHDRIKRRLRVLLADFVRRRYGIGAAERRSCPICDQPRADAIDRHIAAKRPAHTRRPIMRAIREKTGLDLRSPHALIGHTRYHLLVEMSAEEPEHEPELPDTDLPERISHE